MIIRNKMQRKINLLKLAMIAVSAFCFQSVIALQADTVKEVNRVNSINISPMGDIFILQYNRMFAEKNELIIGASYTNPAVLDLIQYPGSEQIFTMELGCRRYLWKNLHAELQIDPQYFICRDTNENKDYNGFGLTPEIRIGYRFEFKVAKVPLCLNLQWFAGYHVVNPKPQSFQDVDGGSLYYSPIPMLFLGLKF